MQKPISSAAQLLTPMSNKKWPVFDQEQIDAAVRVLESGEVNYWTGTEGRHFEAEFARYTKSKHALALSNGTHALDLALRAIDLAPGDEVIVTPRSFMASVATVVQLGGIPRFVDIDRDSQNMSVAHIERAITDKTRAILPVHHAGWPCDMHELMRLAGAHDLAVIEDAAQAHGALIDGQHVGTFGAIGAFSFCQDKIMTTAGEGGMVITDDEEIFEKAQSFKDHGKNFKRQQTPPTHKKAFRYLIDSFGTNYRMTEVQAAIGRVQLRRLNDWRDLRNANAAHWHDCLSNTPGLRFAQPPTRYTHANYKFYTFIEPQQLKSDFDRNRILAELDDAGVNAFMGSCPEIYNEKAFDDYAQFRPEKPLETARLLGETSLMLLVDPTITKSMIERDAQTIERVMRRATR